MPSHGVLLLVHRDHVVAVVQQDQPFFLRGNLVVDKVGISRARHVVITGLENHGGRHDLPQPNANSSDKPIYISEGLQREEWKTLQSRRGGTQCMGIPVGPPASPPAAEPCP